MIKESLKTKACKAIKKTGFIFAENDSDRACVMFLYQPKAPKALKKAKK